MRFDDYGVRQNNGVRTNRWTWLASLCLTVVGLAVAARTMRGFDNLITEAVADPLLRG